MQLKAFVLGPHTLKAPELLSVVLHGSVAAGVLLVQGMYCFHAAPILSALVPDGESANGVYTTVKPVAVQAPRPAGLVVGHCGVPVNATPCPHKSPNTVGRDVVSKPPLITVLDACAGEDREMVSTAIASVV